ncbi:13264_t:CDS:2 [Ambispora leptoticha]|uniref:13264_t:CDS:1 n=1 Tax=Ambispora leptoticha TaxID=144679 RepID=A0A9N9GFC2_9GLOM|nr:13264_t:CDS:2 [Ambispora leptoticha]
MTKRKALSGDESSYIESETASADSSEIEVFTSEDDGRKDFETNPSVTFSSTQKEIHSQVKLINGELVKNTKKPYKCFFEGCDAAYSKPIRLEYHLMVHTGERPYECPEPGCGKTYRRPHNLKVHAIKHSQDPRPIKCPFDGCEKAYQYQHSLDRHIKTHEYGKPFKCTFELCSEAFVKPNQLREHITMHTGKKPFLCEHPGCNKSYNKKQHLTQHQRSSHNVVPRYRCAYESCELEFIKLPELQAHLRNDHEPIKTCSICSKNFTQPRGLRNHMRVHDPNRLLFPCEWEGHKYPITLFASKKLQKKNLNDHVKRRHLHIQRFECDWPECEQKFTSKQELQKHKTKRHEQPEKKRRKINDSIKEASVTELFTGGNYDNSGRKIRCTFEDCMFLFKRNYDLQRHLRSKHSGQTSE